MKSALGLVCMLVAVASVHGVYRTCSAWGDPHWKTFDGCAHDFQANDGYYEVMDDGEIHMQSMMKRCNFRARRPVACHRAMLVELTWGEMKTVISWGWQWRVTTAQPPVGNFAGANISAQADDMVVIRPFSNVIGVSDGNADGCSLTGDVWACPRTRFTNNPVYIMDSTWFVQDYSKRHGIQIKENSRSSEPHTISLGRIYYHISWRAPALSRAQQVTGATNGLCGLYNGQKEGEFTGSDGVNYWPTNASESHLDWRKTCYDRNDKQYKFTHYKKGIPMYNWAKTFYVDGNTFNQLTMPGHHEVYHNKYNLQNFDPNLYNTTEIETMEDLDFDETQNDEQVNQIIDQQCGQIEDEVIRDGCIMDAINLGPVDPGQIGIVADSATAVAELIQQAELSNSESSGLSDGEKGAVGVGVVAGVALVIIGVMFIRLRRKRTELQQALVIARSSGATSSDLEVAQNI